MPPKKRSTYRLKKLLALKKSNGKRKTYTSAKRNYTNSKKYVRRYLGRTRSLASNLPSVTRKVFVYNKTVSIQLAELDREVIRLRGNSLYDPDYEAGGNQPMAFDQWVAMGY